MSVLNKKSYVYYDDLHRIQLLGQTPEQYASESMKNTETFMQEFWDDMGVGFNGTTGQIVDNFDELSMHMSGANHDWVQTANYHEFDSTTMRHEQAQNRAARWQSEANKSTGASFSDTQRFSMFNEARKDAIKDGLYHSPFLHGETPRPQAKPEPTFMQKTSTRLWGAVQTVQGIAEMAIAAGVEIETAGLATALVAAAGAHGMDDAWTGVKTMWTGVPQATSTAKATYAMTGSYDLVIGTDLGLGMVGFGGLSALSDLNFASKSASILSRDLMFQDALLSGLSAGYGAISAGSDNWTVGMSMGVGVPIAILGRVGGRVGTLFSNPYFSSVVSNGTGQFLSYLHSPETTKFSLISPAFGLFGTALSQRQTLFLTEALESYSNSPIMMNTVKFMTTGMIDGTAGAMGTNMAEHLQW